MVLVLIIILLRNRGYWKLKRNQISCTPNSSRPSTAPSKAGLTLEIRIILYYSARNPGKYLKFGVFSRVWEPPKDPFDSTIDWSSTAQDTNSMRIVQFTRPDLSRPSSAFIARSVLRTRSHLADYDSHVHHDSSRIETRHLHDTQSTRFGERSATASSRRSSGNILLINITNIILSS